MRSTTFPSKYSLSTLRRMTKDNLIEYIRLLEKNLYTAECFNEQQAKNCEKLLNGEIGDLLSDLHALMWHSGDGCEICAHKIVDERKPYRCLKCDLGNGADCEPLWQGLRPPNPPITDIDSMKGDDGEKSNGEN